MSLLTHILQKQLSPNCSYSFIIRNYPSHNNYTPSYIYYNRSVEDVIETIFIFSFENCITLINTNNIPLFRYVISNMNMLN